jgi:arginase
MNTFILTPFFLDRPEPPLEHLARADWIVNRPDPPDASMLIRLGAVEEGIAGLVERSVRQGLRPISIAGDCCAAIGAMAGLERAGCRPRLVWLDAHGDFNTPETSPSGFVGGMPLAMLVGRGDQEILRGLKMQPLDEAGIVLCDARDLDPLERDAVSSSRVVHLTSTQQLDALDFGSSPVHLHIDPDVLDPTEAPAML